MGRSDIGVKDGRIVALAEDLPRAASEIDASGLLVLPGGIDSHVHLAQPMAPGIVMADGFESGTRSAAAGGNTTVLSFALQPRGASLRQSVEDYHLKARGQCYVDYGFHLIVTDPTPAVLGQELPALVSSGYPSFKVFMTYDDLVLTDRQLLEVFTVAREHGALVMVHAEGYDQIKFMTDRLERDGKTQPLLSRRLAPRAGRARGDPPGDLPCRTDRHPDHDRACVRPGGDGADPMGARARPENLCRNLPAISGADRRGSQRPQHGYERGQICLLAAAARPRLAGGDLARAIEAGVFQTFSSDHCPFRFDDDAGKTGPKARTSFRWVPNGIPGIAARLPILFSEGVSKGRISLPEFVALTATNHAKMYGLYPRKGSIMIGADADIAIWDADRKVRLSQDLMQHGSDYTPYEGFEVTGWPVKTLVRGAARRRRRPHRRRAGIWPVPAAGDGPASMNASFGLWRAPAFASKCRGELDEPPLRRRRARPSPDRRRRRSARSRRNERCGRR